MYDHVKSEACQYAGAMVGGLGGASTGAFQGAPSMPPPTTPARSEVAHQLDMQEKLSSMLHDAIDSLEVRLGPVLANVPQASETGGGAPACATPIANCIQSNTLRFVTAHERLRLLIARIGV